MADQLGQSVGDMYKGAWGPSILQIILFAIYTFLLTRLRPNALPGVPPAGDARAQGNGLVVCPYRLYQLGATGSLSASGATRADKPPVAPVAEVLFNP